MQTVNTSQGQAKLEKKAIDLGLDFAIEAFTSKTPMELGINTALALNHAYNLYKEKKNSRPCAVSHGVDPQHLGYHSPK